MMQRIFIPKRILVASALQLLWKQMVAPPHAVSLRRTLPWIKDSRYHCTKNQGEKKVIVYWIMQA